MKGIRFKDGRFYVRCQRCGREQTIAAKDKPGGVTPQEAKSFGWTEHDFGWLCPFDDGKEEALQEKPAQGTMSPSGPAPVSTRRKKNRLRVGPSL